MKILVMVLSCMKPPYDKLYRTQKETWDSIEVEGVETAYYFGDDYNLMHVAFREALKENWDKEWDVLYRTNSSSYVNKQLLKDYLQDKQTTGLWIGDETGYNSGASFIISRDLAEILMNEIPDGFQQYEDLLASNIISAKGYKTEIGQRCYYDHDNKNYFDCYHIRCKPADLTTVLAGTLDDRERDIAAMKHIFSNQIRK
jgi:hypothetical protein